MIGKVFQELYCIHDLFPNSEAANNLDIILNYKKDMVFEFLTSLVK